MVSVWLVVLFELLADPEPVLLGAELSLEVENSARTSSSLQLTEFELFRNGQSRSHYAS